MIAINEDALDGEHGFSFDPAIPFPTAITVAIVQDKSAAREELSAILNHWDWCRITGEYASGEEAIQGMGENPPEIVLMDIDLPGMSGIECTREIKRMLPDTRVLMFTMFTDWDLILRAFQAGASGYLLKGASPKDLETALENAKAGGAPLAPPVASQVLKYFRTIDFSGRKPVKRRRRRGELGRLSSKETEVLRCLVDGDSYKGVGERLDIKMDTVRTHIRRIYRKLQVNSRTEAVVKYVSAQGKRRVSPQATAIS
ncbi:MAG TPA: response regulator transcription factor [Chthoniobacterales bacterium]